jgi:nitroreductase
VRNEIYKPLIESIPLRRSTRAFLPEQLPKEYTEQIKHFFKDLELPFIHHARIEIFQAEPGKKLYNNGINPIDNLALIAETDLASISKAGFAGELVMLYAVSLGLSTCWFGHYKLSELGKYIDGIASADRIRESTMGYGYGKHIDAGERVICCMPFGRQNEKSKRLVDIVGAKLLTKRNPIEDLLEIPGSLNSCPEEIKDVLEYARLAPSAANAQMWRFGFGNGFTTVTVAKPVGYKHFKWEHPDVDIGMCAAHIWLGLLEKGYSPKVDVKADADRAFWMFDF